MVNTLLAIWTPQGVLWYWMLLYSILMGLTLGSFLNVCIDRLPWQGLSAHQKQQIRVNSLFSSTIKQYIVADRLTLATPARSLCFACGHPLRWYDNLPIFSYLWLKGRCRQCKQAYGQRAFWIELANGIIYGLLYSVFGLSMTSLLLALNASFGLVYFGILIEQGTVSTKIIYGALLLIAFNLGLLGTPLVLK